MGTCEIEGCDRPILCRGRCRRHYRALRREGRVCSIAGCDKPFFERGWCKMHHRRWERHGDPLHTELLMTPMDRLAVYVQRGAPDACWPWTGATQANGYGVTTREGRAARAHRVAYEIAKGPIPEGFEIDHQCHDPQTCPGGPSDPHRRCCNPAHLIAVVKGINNSSSRCVSVNALKTHCPRGHEYTPENTKILRSGSRACRECARISSRERARARRAAKREAQLRL